MCEKRYSLVIIGDFVLDFVINGVINLLIDFLYRHVFWKVLKVGFILFLCKFKPLVAIFGSNSSNFGLLIEFLLHTTSNVGFLGYVLGHKVCILFEGQLLSNDHFQALNLLRRQLENSLKTSNRLSCMLFLL